MITLAIFEQMVKDGVADLTKDENFFLEEAPLQQNGNPAQGVWLVTRAGQASRTGFNSRSTIDFYVAFKNKVRIDNVLAEIERWIRTNKCFCELKNEDIEGTGFSYVYNNVRISPTTTPNTDGVTENGLIVKMASVLVVYDEDLTN